MINWKNNFELLDEVRKKLAEGKKVEIIAQELKLSYQQVYQAIKRWLPQSKKAFSDQEKKMRKLARMGFTLEQIGQLFNIKSRQRVEQIIKSKKPVIRYWD